MKELAKQYRKELTAWKVAHEEARKLNDIRSGTSQTLKHQLKPTIEKIVASHVKGLYVNWFFSDLDLEIVISGIRKSKQFYFLKNPLRWAKEDPHSGPGHRYGIPCPGPFSIEIMVMVCDNIEAETGIKAVCSGLEQAPLEEPFKSRSYASLEKWFESKGSKTEFVDDGKKEYMGWDCTDYWVQLEIDGVLFAYWTTDAHGFSFNRCADSREPTQWREFEAWLVRE